MESRFEALGALLDQDLEAGRRQRIGAALEELVQCQPATVAAVPVPMTMRS
jgi:hypothetical protein